MDTVKTDIKKDKIVKDANKIKSAGSSKAQAFSLSLKANGANDISTMKKYYSDKIRNRNNDISVGSFVKLVSDNTGNKYEVININNKGDVELRDTSSNAVISKSKQDLLPIIMEKDMKKINEAQYTVSINNLETQDADTLSQMLSLASQAEGNNSEGLEVINAPEVEMGMEEPSDFVDAELDADALPSDEVVGSDVVPTDVEPEVNTEPAFEVSDIPPETDELVESKEEASVKTSPVKVKVFDIEWDCDGDDPEECGLPEEMELEVEHDSDMELEDEISDKLSDETGFCHNGFRYEMVEDKKIDEADQDKPASKEETKDDKEASYYLVYTFSGNMCQGSDPADTWEEAEQIATDIYNSGNDAIIAGYDSDDEEFDLGEKGEFIHDENETKDADTDLEVPADKSEDKKLLNEKGDESIKYFNSSNTFQNLSDEKVEELYKKYKDEGLSDDEIFDKIYSEDTNLDEQKSQGNRFKEYGEDSFYELWTLKSTNPDLFNYYMNDLTDEERKDWDNWLKTKNPTEKDVRIGHFDDNIDEQIAETLRLAGVKLDEEAVKNAGPEIVDEKTLIANKKDLETGKESGEEQRPEYQEVKTEDTWGKDSSKGMPRCSMKLKEMVDMKKIKAICETANYMYHKRNKEDWLFLDRRYIEKLMKEGVSYSNASKMLLIAKK